MEKVMAPHSSTLAWKIPWTEEPGGLQSMGSLRVRHDWTTSLSIFTFMHWRRKWQPTRVLAWRIPGTGEPGGLPSMWSHRLRHDWRDLVAAAAWKNFSGSEWSFDVGKDRRQKEKGMTADKMVGWHHRLNAFEFEQVLGDGEGQGSLACRSPWGHKESDTTEWLTNNNRRVKL